MDQAYVQRLVNVLEEQRNKAMNDAATCSARADVLASQLERANARIAELEKSVSPDSVHVGGGADIGEGNDQP